jgi:hypothetical protein
MANGDPNYAIGVLSTRVSNIESAVQNISTQLTGQIAALSTKMDEQQKGMADRGRVNWIAIGSLFFTAVGASVTIIAILGSLARTPLDTGIADLKDSVKGLVTAAAAQRDRAISRDEFEEFKRTYEANRLNFKADNTTTLAAIRADIEKIEMRGREDSKQVVPRGEHEEKWRAYDQQLTDKQRQLDEMKLSQGSTYGVRDVIQRLEKQIEDLREEKYRASRMAP